METIHRKYARIESNTNRGIEVLKPIDREGNYWHDLGFENLEEFLRWIEGKKVVDIGSGYGFMGLDVKRRKGEQFSTIINVNPSLRDPDFQENLRNEIGIRYHLNPNTPEGREEIEELYEFAKTHSIASEWDSLYVRKKDRNYRGTLWSYLPFAEESVDIIISNFSFPMYVRYAETESGSKRSEDIVEEKKRALRSMISMLKPGGEIRLFPVRREVDEECLREFGNSIIVEWPSIQSSDSTFYLRIRKPREETVASLTEVA